MTWIHVFCDEHVFHVRIININFDISGFKVFHGATPQKLMIFIN